MLINIIKSKDFKTGQWAGGTTTELFIYPKHSNYQDKDFDFRISSASVDIEESIFTNLPDVSRRLMILDGEIEINHQNRYSKHMGKFDIDEFEGHWNTISKGKCIDFNVMTKNGAKSKLYGLFISHGEPKQIISSSLFTFIYAHKGRTKFTVNNEVFFLEERELLVSKENESVQITADAFSNSELAIAEITID